jgi:hypothetical protein
MLYGKATEVALIDVDTASSLTLMSADIERIVTGMETGHEVWSNTLEIGLAMYLLQRELGVACAIPIGVAIGRPIPLCFDVTLDSRAPQFRSLGH